MTTPTGSAVPDDDGARVIPCRQCGAQMRFTPSTGRLRCQACGATNEPPLLDDEQRAAPHAELDFEAHLRQQLGNEPEVSASVVDCPQCGAQTQFDAHVVASSCAFCSTPLLTSSAHATRRIRPRGIVPFSLEPVDAQQVFRQWLAGRWLAPNALKKQVRAVDALRGVYVPCWTFDARTSVDYAGQKGVDRTTRRTNARGETESETVTDWTPKQGRFDLAFDDLLVPASRSVPDHLAAALSDWNLSGLTPYAGDYVAGFTVEAYQVGLEAGFTQARRQIDTRVEAEVRRAIGGDRQTVSRIDTQYSGITFKHLLLPLWICSYRHGGKVWQVVVNGQTGSVHGDRPYSPWKVGTLVVLAILAALLLMTVMGGR